MVVVGGAQAPLAANQPAQQQQPLQQTGTGGFVPGGVPPSFTPPHFTPASFVPAEQNYAPAALPGRPAMIETLLEAQPAYAPQPTQPERAAPTMRVVEPPAPRPAAPARSLFASMTGAFRRQPPAPLPVEPPRTEPQFEAEQPASQRAAEEMGLEIPAFLRRQQSP